MHASYRLVFESSQLSDPIALRAWAKEMVPDTIAEAWSLVMMGLVGMFALSCIQVRQDPGETRSR